MSVALAPGFYGLWRLVFVTLAPGAAVVGRGHPRPRRPHRADRDPVRDRAGRRRAAFLGFSTVEHSGITLIGFGVALVGQATGQPELAAAGLLAATLHRDRPRDRKDARAALQPNGSTAATGTTPMRPLGRARPSAAAHRDRPRARDAHARRAAAVRRLRQRVVHARGAAAGVPSDDTLARLLMALAAAAARADRGPRAAGVREALRLTIVLGRARTDLGRLHEPRGPAPAVRCSPSRRCCSACSRPGRSAWSATGSRRRSASTPARTRHLAPARARPGLPRLLRPRADLARARAGRVRVHRRGARAPHRGRGRCDASAPWVCGTRRRPRPGPVHARPPTPTRSASSCAACTATGGCSSRGGRRTQPSRPSSSRPRWCP